MASRAANATICWVRLDKKGSPPTRSAPARRSRMVANAASISLAELALRTSNCRPSVRAASCPSLCMRADSGSFGFTNIAITAAGNEFVQQAEPLAGDQVAEPAHSGDIAARPVEARHVALLDWVAARREHNRNGLGRRHGSQHGSAASRRGDHSDLAADQIRRKRRQSIVLIFCKTGFDCDVAAIDIAGFTQTTAEGCLEIRAITFP